MPLGLNLSMGMNRGRFCSRTNEARNTPFAGGTGVASPTGHSTSVGTFQAVTMSFAYGTEGGIEYVDCIYSGTASAAASPVYGIALDTAVVAVAGQGWTFAADLKLVAGALAGITADLAIRQGTAAGAGVLTNATNVTITGTRTRFSHTVSAAEATTARVTGRFRLNIPISTVVSATVRLYRPQLELGLIATAFIPNPNTGASATAYDQI